MVADSTVVLPEILSVFDSAEVTYVERTLRPTDLLSSDSLKLYFQLLVFPIVLAACVILLPLGGVTRLSADDDSNIQLNSWSYVMFQVVYNTVAYNSIVWEITLPIRGVISWKMMYGYLRCASLMGIFLMYVLMVVIFPNTNYNCMSSFDMFGQKVTLGFLPALGITFEFLLLWVTVLVFSIWKDRQLALGMDSNSSSPRSVTKSQSRNLEIARDSTIQSGSCIEEDSLQQLSASLLTDSRVLTSHTKLAMRALVTNLLMMGLYWWCILFTAFFEQFENDSNASYGIIAFFLVLGIESVSLRVTTNLVDQCTTPPTASMNIILGIMADTFLIIFQRNLFSLVTTWSDFIVLAIVSAIYELVVYQFQITETYEKLHDYLISRAKEARNMEEHSKISLRQRMCIIFAMTHGWRPGKIFVHKNALNISYRFVIRIVATASYIIFTIFLRYGYNSQYYSDASSLSESNFVDLMAFILISFFLDSLVMVFTDYTLRARTNVSLMNRFVSFFGCQEGKIYTAFLIWIMGHIITDVFVAKIPYDSVRFSTS